MTSENQTTDENAEHIATLLECNQHAIAGDISWLTAPGAALIRAQSAEIERLRAALDDLEMHAVALDVAPGWQCICNTEWEQVYGKRP